MISVLFLSHISSPLPEMAKSIAESIAPEDTRIMSASGADLESDIMDKSKKVMKVMGLEISGQGLSVEDVDLHSFDLIVCFTEDTCSLLPSIPGNPLIIRWHFPGFPHGLDKKMVNKALERAQNNKTEAARLLGVGMATLYRFLANNNLL